MNLHFSGIFALAVALAWVPASAQEAGEPAVEAQGSEIEAIEPAVDTGAASPDRAEEIDNLEPGVPTQVLLTDNRRSVPGGGVMDELDLGSIEITGNQELPKVLYIVPWQKSDPGDLMGRPANTLLDEVLAPVDRGEFTRQVDYYDDLFELEQEQ